MNIRDTSVVQNKYFFLCMVHLVAKRNEDKTICIFQYNFATITRLYVSGPQINSPILNIVVGNLSAIKIYNRNYAYFEYESFLFYQKKIIMHIITA